jgi:hypothetical protein
MDRYGFLVPVRNDLCISVTVNYFIGKNGSRFLMLQCFCSDFQLISSLLDNLIA